MSHLNLVLTVNNNQRNICIRIIVVFNINIDAKYGITYKAYW